MKCPKCSYEWVPRKETPKSCPECKTRLGRYKAPSYVGPNVADEYGSFTPSHIPEEAMEKAIKLIDQHVTFVGDKP